MSDSWKRHIITLFVFGGFVAILFSFLSTGRRKQEQREAAMAALERASRYPLILYDDFSSNENNWPVGDLSDEGAEERRLIENGKYRWESTSFEPFISWVWWEGEYVFDFYLEVEARLDRTAGTWTAYFGPAFRIDDFHGSFYAFGHSEFVERVGGGDDESFNYAFYRFIRFLDNETEVLVADYAGRYSVFPGLPSIRHPPEGIVSMVVVGEGAKFWCFVDGQFVDSLEDEAISRGLVGLAVIVPNAGEETIIEFDKIELRAR